MNDQQKKDLMRGFLRTWETGHIDKLLPLFSPECTWQTPQGTLKGISQIEMYLRWVCMLNADLKYKEIGLGIIIQGETAVIEHEMSGTYHGEKWVSPSICVWEFSDDKIVNLRTYYDLLGQIHQVAKGPVEKITVNAIVKASREGLSN